MRVDCHCHILPSLDDGAASLEESVFLARKQMSWGFERIVCTPHRNRLYHNTPETVMEACERLREELVRRDIPLETVPSMEYRLVPETWPETLAAALGRQPYPRRTAHQQRPPGRRHRPRG